MAVADYEDVHGAKWSEPLPGARENRCLMRELSSHNITDAVCSLVSSRSATTYRKVCRDEGFVGGAWRSSHPLGAREHIQDAGSP
ncbi:predicted protein [Sclerotinia sclerotiorum 1980 UF-70]|uniref:Uncharacterized protein n=1 Tax=Sclerotinia sclerotiorum (strain ATCC 18683 / 1980 / Ss-1) TaxID=665079 RepID=A7EK59_SCLS1|nr:predicted protein [Sclerotinia sclerotiorum 1980 UF-70]EDO03225.1 predicted protein [Sclerotinia sclerotiorum 1980 UF-70]